MADDPHKHAVVDAINLACEVAWNLREWLREANEEPSLHRVLRSLLPVIRRRLQMALVDAD